MSLRVLHVLAPSSYGGLESVVECLAAGQHARGHEVHIAAIISEFQDPPPFLSTLERTGVNVHRLTTSARAYHSQISLVARVQRASHAQVLHSHGYVGDVMLSMRTARSGRPTLSTVHGFTGGGWKNRAYEWVQCRALSRLDAVIAVSKGVARDLAKRGLSRRVHVIQNAGAKCRDSLAGDVAVSLLGLPSTVPRLGWIGRLSREKGLDVLVDALPLFSDLPWHLAVLGDGGERPHLERRVNELGLSHKVTFCGQVPSAARYMAAFDTIIMSSRTEGTPIVLLEAMSASVPVVVTAVGGIPEVVSRREALLVPSQDPAALAASIRFALLDPDAGKNRASCALARFQSDFSMTLWLDRYDHLYDALLSSNPFSEP